MLRADRKNQKATLRDYAWGAGVGLALALVRVLAIGHVVTEWRGDVILLVGTPVVLAVSLVFVVRMLPSRTYYVLLCGGVVWTVAVLVWSENRAGSDGRVAFLAVAGVGLMLVDVCCAFWPYYQDAERKRRLAELLETRALSPAAVTPQFSAGGGQAQGLPRNVAAMLAQLDEDDQPPTGAYAPPSSGGHGPFANPYGSSTGAYPQPGSPYGSPADAGTSQPRRPYSGPTSYQ